MSRTLLLLLFLVLPIQGMAAVIGSLTCAADERDKAAAIHVHGEAGGETAHSHPESGTGGENHSSHLCCHHFSSAATAAVPKLASAEPPVFASSLALLQSLYIPDLPQRPPRG